MSDRTKFSAKDVSKSFYDERTGNAVEAIGKLDLDVVEGEFVVLIGPSGCGKSTFLYMCAGFESPSSGEVCFDGATVTKPGDRKSTRLNSSHVAISYAVFCLKKKIQ